MIASMYWLANFDCYDPPGNNQLKEDSERIARWEATIDPSAQSIRAN